MEEPMSRATEKPISSADSQSDPYSLRTSLADRYFAVRSITEKLAAPLSPEDCALQSMPDCSPVKWHLAHTSWFFETFILEAVQPGYHHFHPEFRYLFNSYYQSVGEQYPRPQRGLISRPSLSEVLEYRKHVNDRVLDFLGSAASETEILNVVELGLQHEQQHQELILTDIKNLLSLNPLAPHYQSPKEMLRQPASPIEWTRFEEGLRHIGYNGSGFAFDNEGPQHQVFLESFEVASRLVTCGEYLEFILDGGYSRPELWLSDGWNTVQTLGWKAPLYWVGAGPSWSLFTLSGLRPLHAEEPVAHVSYYEADAYAHWAGARLPLEQEWESVTRKLEIDGNFAESGLLHPTGMNQQQSGFAQMFGDVWEWTSSAYSPYPRYKPPAGALGEYNGKFMSSQMVLRGGSCVTPRSHIRATYRNFFPPNARWQFSGIRLARDAE